MRADASRVAAAAAALLAVSCVTREIHATPFAITVTDRTGAPVLGSNPLVVEGHVLSLSPTQMVVDAPNLGGAITIAFATPDAAIAFPAQLRGALVLAAVEVAPASGAGAVRAPDGTPLLHPALGVIQEDAPSGIAYEFFLGEGDLEDQAGLPVVPPLLEPAVADVPGFSVFADNTQFEPSSCGLLYYDLLRVDGDSSIALRRGEGGTVRVDVRTGTTRPPWNVRHVLSFHRSDCSRSPRAWTQLAAWRDPEGG